MLGQWILAHYPVHVPTDEESFAINKPTVLEAVRDLEEYTRRPDLVSFDKVHALINCVKEQYVILLTTKVPHKLWKNQALALRNLLHDLSHLVAECFHMPSVPSPVGDFNEIFVVFPTNDCNFLPTYSRYLQ